MTAQLTVIDVLVAETTGVPVIASAGVTVSVVAADLVGSCVLVAVTVTVVPVAGAVSRPAGVIVPAEADQVTAELKLFVPVTEEAQFVVPLAVTVVAWQATETPVIVGGGVTETMVLADLVGSCVLVAVTVTAVAVAGTLSRPAGVIVPAEADQFTVEA